MLLAPHFDYILATYVFAKVIRSLKSSTLKPDRIFLFFTALVLVVYKVALIFTEPLISILDFLCNFLCNRNLKWYIHGSEYLQKYLTGPWWQCYRKGLVREKLKLSFTGKRRWACRTYKEVAVRKMFSMKNL